MTQQQIKLIMNKGRAKSLAVKTWQTDDEFVDPFIVIADAREPYLLEMTHDKLNTVLVLTRLVPWIVLAFKEDNEIWGTYLSLNSDNAGFAIQTQARKLLFLPWPLKFNASNVVKFKR